jgi:hypothetical protein
MKANVQFDWQEFRLLHSCARDRRETVVKLLDTLRGSVAVMPGLADKLAGSIRHCEDELKRVDSILVKLDVAQGFGPGGCDA